MACVIAKPCIGVKDTACIEACPVDRIHRKENEPAFDTEAQLYIDRTDQRRALHCQENLNMPVTIGAAESLFSNPIGLLSDCRRRIGRFLETLQTIPKEKRGRSLDAEYRRTPAPALNYFRDAAPKHTADEEEALFPVLRSLLGQAHVEPVRIEQVLSEIDRLENDHNLAGKWHRECDETGKLRLRDDGLCLRDTGRFGIILSLLVRLYRSHIAIEEHEIFPAVQKALSDRGKAVIGRSMALRRGAPFASDEPLAVRNPAAAG
jgi:hemerythrin-like domain-containing protein